ncbi:hypothetical protein OCU04_005162 [Sclerotinia nivalis]|uniref:Rhodopsin domain-containing protein n=1 Tax=Sclerotinia nivalis TaxID=352851 RepID=A0A9X0ANU2_9HELO|nr:hypothetical protein OCU04_005162 [Sclerotinia nivalis]
MGICLVDGAYNGAFGSPTPAAPSGLSPEEEELYVDPTTTFGEKLEFPFQLFMMLAYGSIKLSIIAFYRRIFVVCRNDAFDIVSKIAAAIIFLWTVAFIFIIIFDCGTAVWANWGSTTAQLKYCAIGFTSEYGLAISDFLVDIFVFLLPLPIIWRLRLSTNKRIAVSGIFLLGASAVGASIARMILYIQILTGLTQNAVIDPNQVLAVGLWWSMLEAGLSLIAACLPTLSFLFTHFNLQTALRSIQSVFSLRSNNHTSANHSAPSHPHLNPYVDLEASKLKTPSETVTVTPGRGSREEYGMHEMHSD